MRVIHSGAAAVLAFSAAAGCIPNRDNPHDPALAPKVTLEVPITSGNPQTDFLFDASASSDPQGHALRFDWEVVDPETGATDFTVSTGTSGILTTTIAIPVAALTSSGTAEIRRFVRVTATARSGSRASLESLDLVVHTDPPVISPGEDLFVSPLWTGEVLLDACGGVVASAGCTSLDPDGEVLSYEWEQLPIGDDVALADTDQRIARFAADGTQKRSLLFRLTGRDTLTERQSILRVNFTPQLWVATTNPTRVYRFDPTFRTVTATNGSSGAISIELPSVLEPTVDGEGWFLGIRTSTPSNVLHRLDRDLNRLQSWTLPSANVFWISPRADGGAWFSNRLRVGLASVDGGVTAVSVGVATAYTDGRRIFDRGDGTAWVTTLDAVYWLDETMTLTPIATGFPFITASGLANDGAFWVASDLGDPRLSRMQLTRFASDGTETGSFEMPGERFVQEIAARPETGHVWVHDDIERTLFDVAPDFTLRDVGGPRTRLTPAGQSARQMWPEPDNAGIWISDSQVGELVYLFDTGDEAYELGRLAIETVVPDASRWQSPVFDAATGTVFTAAAPFQGAGTLVTLPQSLRTTAEVPFQFEAALIEGLVGDRTRGAMWASDAATFSQHLRRISDKGRELVSIASQPTGLVALPDGSVWAASDTDLRLYAPDGTTLVEWLNVGPGGVDRLRTLAVDPTSATACLLYRADFAGFAIRLDLTTGIGDTLPTYDDPTGCVVTPDGALWLSHGADIACGGTSRLLRFAPGSMMPTQIFTTEFGNAFTTCEPPPVAIDPRGSSVWFTDDQSQTTTRFDANGEILTVPIPANASDVQAVPALNGSNAVELWIASAAEHEITRLLETDPDPLSTFRVPTGTIVEMDVIP